MFKTITQWIKTNIPTMPWWHNFTGPYRKAKSCSEPGVTWLDEISKQHDQDCIGGSEWVFGAFKSQKTSKRNIRADFMFIINYVFFVTSAIVINIQKAGSKNIFARVGVAIGNTVVDMIVGAFGCIVFTLNIFLNSINLIIFAKPSKK